MIFSTFLRSSDRPTFTSFLRAIALLQQPRRTLWDEKPTYTHISMNIKHNFNQTNRTTLPIFRVIQQGRSASLIVITGSDVEVISSRILVKREFSPFILRLAVNRIIWFDWANRQTTRSSLLIGRLIKLQAIALWTSEPPEIARISPLQYSWRSWALSSIARYSSGVKRVFVASGRFGALVWVITTIARPK